MTFLDSQVLTRSKFFQTDDTTRMAASGRARLGPFTCPKLCENYTHKLSTESFSELGRGRLNAKQVNLSSDSLYKGSLSQLQQRHISIQVIDFGFCINFPFVDPNI
jgi:hypothetical protein